MNGKRSVLNYKESWHKEKENQTKEKENRTKEKRRDKRSWNEMSGVDDGPLDSGTSISAIFRHIANNPTKLPSHIRRPPK